MKKGAGGTRRPLRRPGPVTPPARSRDSYPSCPRLPRCRIPLISSACAACRARAWSERVGLTKSSVCVCARARLEDVRKVPLGLEARVVVLVRVGRRLVELGRPRLEHRAHRDGERLDRRRR
eukprot:5914771-Pleurochrysis_carterae.AAC.4